MEALLRRVLSGEWNEPYIREVDEPDYETDELFREAVAKGVIRPHGTGQFIYDHPREEVGSLFQDENKSAKGLNPTAFEEALTRHRILAQEILEDVVEKIIATDGRDLEAKVQSGAYPAFLRKEIEAYLRGES